MVMWYPDTCVLCRVRTGKTGKYRGQIRHLGSAELHFPTECNKAIIILISRRKTPNRQCVIWLVYNKVMLPRQHAGGRRLPF